MPVSACNATLTWSDKRHRPRPAPTPPAARTDTARGMHRRRTGPAGGRRDETSAEELTEMVVAEYRKALAERQRSE